MKKPVTTERPTPYLIVGGFLVLVGLSTALFGPGCPKEQVPDPIIPTDTNRCGAACARLEELQCPEGEPLLDGTTCVEFCRNVQNAGFPLLPSCIEKINSCEEINDCARR